MNAEPRQKIAICMECSVHDMGGVEVLVLELLRGLSRNFEIILVTPDTPESLQTSPAAAWVADLVTWSPENPTRASGKRLAEALKQRGVKLAHFHFGGTYAFGARKFGVCPVIDTKKLGIRVVTTNHLVHPPLEGYCGPFRSLWVKLALFPLAWVSRLHVLAHTDVEFTVSKRDCAMNKRIFWPLAGRIQQMYHSKLDENEQPPEANPETLNVETGGQSSQVSSLSSQVSPPPALSSQTSIQPSQVSSFSSQVSHPSALSSQTSIQLPQVSSFSSQVSNPSAPSSQTSIQPSQVSSFSSQVSNPSDLRSPISDLPSPISHPRSSTIICVGTIGERKGQHILVEAFDRIAGDFPDWRLRLIGRVAQPHYYAVVEKALAAAVHRDRIEVAGCLPEGEVVRAMYESAIFAFPSFSEGLGLALQEAMFRGCACIGSDVGGIPDLIQNEKTGILVPTGDVVRLADGLRRLILDEKQRLRLARQAREFVLEHSMTSHRMVERQCEAYHTVL